MVGYTGSLASGNMVLIKNMTRSALTTHNYVCNGKHQQHFKGIAIPTASSSQHFFVGNVENSPTKTKVALHVYSHHSLKPMLMILSREEETI